MMEPDYLVAYGQAESVVGRPVTGADSTVRTTVERGEQFRQVSSGEVFACVGDCERCAAVAIVATVRCGGDVDAAAGNVVLHGIENKVRG